MNPLALKELREMARSNKVLIFILAYLFCMSGVTFYCTFFENNAFYTIHHILSFFYFLTTALFTCIVAPVLLLINNLNDNRDYITHFYTLTNMSAWKIVRGKIISSIALLFIITAISSGFYATLYLLGGINLIKAMYVVVFISSVAFLCHLVMLILLQIFQTTILKVIATVFLLPLAAVFFFLHQFLYVENDVIINTMYNKYDLIGLLGYMVLAFFLYICVTVKYMSCEANRSFCVRATLTAILFSYIFVWFLLPTAEYKKQMLSIAFMCIGVTTVITFLIAPLEPHIFSTRIRKSIPSFISLRIICVLFFPGSLFAYVWALSILLITTFICFFFDYSSVYIFPFSFLTLERLLIVCLYILAYSLTALFIYNDFFVKRFSRKAVLVITFILIIVGIIIPLSFSGVRVFLTQNAEMSSSFNMHVGSLVAIFFNEKYTVHYVFLIPWIIFGFIINGKYFWQEIRQFKPLPASLQSTPQDEENISTDDPISSIFKGEV